MRRRHQLFAAVAVVAALSMTAAACSSSKPKSSATGSGSPTAASTGGSTGGNAGTGKKIVLGTTDKVISLDPAGAYDMGSWTLQWNIY